MRPDRRATRPDPILAAGAVSCHTCRRRGWPIDALWISGDQLLVTYAPPCWHTGLHGSREPVTMPVTPSELTPGPPEPEHCRGTVRGGSRKGLPCTRLAPPGHEYCPWHQQQGGGK